MLEQQIAVLRAQVDSLAAQANQVRQEIEDRTLRAPFDAIIDKTFIHQGDYVSAGQWLMMLHDPDNVWVEAEIKETEIGRVHVGAAVTVWVDALPGAVRARPGAAGRQCRHQPVRAAAEPQSLRQLHQDHPARAGAHRHRPAGAARCSPG